MNTPICYADCEKDSEERCREHRTTISGQESQVQFSTDPLRSFRLEKSKQVFRQTPFLAISLVNLQDPVLADEADPPTCSAFLHRGLDLPQQLPEFPKARLCLTLDRHEIVLPDLPLRDGEECAATVDSEVMNGCLREVELWIRVAPVEVCRRDLRTGCHFE